MRYFLIILLLLPYLTHAETLSKILNSSLIELKNGKKIKLSSVITPYHLQLDNYEQNAVDFLNVKLQGKNIQVFEQLEDRYGNIIADLFVNNDYLQEEMVRLGLALVYNQQTKYKYFIRVNNAEQATRKQLSNIWKSDNIVVKNSDDVSKYDKGKFAIISGQVKNVSMHKGITYINFGDDWRNDFTIIVEKEHRRYLNNLFPLTGKYLITKRILENYNGSAIKVNYHGQITKQE